VAKSSRHSTTEKDNDSVVGVARYIGSTLGTIVAKVSPPAKSKPRKKNHKTPKESAAARSSKKKQPKRRSATKA
jgi:hypothetical protein